MRCNKCQDQLYEYFDGTLTPSRRQTVQEHLAQCPACHAVFEQERQFSKSMTGLFEQQTRNLHIAPQISQNVMARLKELPQENQISEIRRHFSLIPIFNRPPRELIKIAAAITILLAGFYMGNVVWQQREDESRARLEKETDWRYILVSSRTCYFLNRPELQLMQ